MVNYKMYLLLCTVSVLSLSRGFPIEDTDWLDYKFKFGKFYEKGEDVARYGIWKENIKDIIAHNSQGERFKKGVNNFTDQTHEEFHRTMGSCYKIPSKHLHGNVTSSSGSSTFLLPSHVDIPDKVNWVEKGYVTPVKNQGHCGSCWAFSTTGSLEGQMFRKTGRLPELSEQNLVDCSSSYGNHGCQGGLPDFAFAYIRDNHGVDSEQGYPYYARELGNCYYRRAYSQAAITGFYDLTPSGDEELLKKAVAAVGPISIAIDASHPSLQHYRSGVYYDPACGNTLRDLDHAVLVVGYGTSEEGEDYWLVKNSWSEKWGEGGYVKIARNRGNHCGVATKPTFPIV